MEGFVKGDVVIVSFPFSNLSASKKRPALVLSVLKTKELVLCEITSHASRDDFDLPLTENDFSSGKLSRESTIRPAILFTADQNIVFYRAGQLSNSKLSMVIENACKMLQN